MEGLEAAPGSLAGRVALVTGSSRGIGSEIARALAAEGAAVAINHPGDDGERAAAVVAAIREAGSRAFTCAFDVAERAAVERGIGEIAARWGRLDIAVNNAGICPFADFFAVTPEVWDRVLAVNARGVFLVSQEAARLMRERRWGRIVNVTSISGLAPTDPRQVPYCASKAAANMLTRSLALVLAPWGITVNAVLPGTVPTDINREVLESPGTREALLEKTPLGRLGTPQDVAAAVAFLASPAASWVTGSLIPVDGGFLG